jgi:hypothetical protein
MADISHSFMDAVLAVEEAAVILAEAERYRSVEKARKGAARGANCTQLVIKAAEILASLGEPEEARSILRAGLALSGPTAPLQHAYARHCRAAGQLDEAVRWLKGAMLRARPTASTALELCEIELARQDGPAVAEALAMSVRLRWLDNEGLRAAYRRLRDAGHDEIAIVPAMMLHLRTQDDAELRRDLAKLLAQHDPYSGLPAEVIDGLRLVDPMTVTGVAAAVAHDGVMSGLDSAAVIARAEEREASDFWLDEPKLWSFLKDRIDQGRPFSFVRMSDGEGRFIAAIERSLLPWLEDRDADAVLRQIWMTWFGQEVCEIPEQALRDLARQFGSAMRHADLVGRTSAAMYRHDQRHFGYRAALDCWFDGKAPVKEQYCTEAAYNPFLHRRDPFLAELLAGQRFIGAISPYADLARRLAAHIGIACHHDYPIPGETRLGREEEASNRGTHFPLVFDRLMREIDVPFPGACFVVAGGLLGKVYCERIRALGGVALDIGALADGWMGFNTRGAGFDAAVPHRLP